MEEINCKILNHLNTIIQILVFIKKIHFTLVYGLKESIVKLHISTMIQILTFKQNPNSHLHMSGKNQLKISKSLKYNYSNSHIHA